MTRPSPLLARFTLAYLPPLALLAWATHSLPALLPVGVEALVSAALLVAAALWARGATTRATGRPPTSREWAGAVVGALVVDLVAHVALAIIDVGTGDVPVLVVGATALALVGTVALHAAALYGTTALLVRHAARPAP